MSHWTNLTIRKDQKEILGEMWEKFKEENPGKYKSFNEYMRYVHFDKIINSTNDNNIKLPITVDAIVNENIILKDSQEDKTVLITIKNGELNCDDQNSLKYIGFCLSLPEIINKLQQ